MLTPDLTLDKSSGSDTIFTLISNDKSGSIRIDRATNLAEPCTMSIKHSVAGKGSDAVDRHLLQFVLTKTNPVTGVPRSATVNLTLAIPRDLTISTVDAKDLVTYVADFILDGSVANMATSSNLEALLRGES